MVAGQAGRVSDAERIADLERELRQCDGKITELKTEHGEMLEIMRRMREHAEDHDRLLDQWIDVFQMSQDDTGTFNFDPDQSELWQRHVELWHKREALVKQWNKFVPIYNATISPQPVGRPLAASAVQQIDVLKRRKSGESLRGIAQATGLSFSTVRTIVGNKTGTGRQSEHAKALRRHEYDRLRAAAYRARKKQRDALPKLIAELRKDGAALIKAAKGLGR